MTTPTNLSDEGLNEMARKVANQYDGDWQCLKEPSELSSMIASALKQVRRQTREEDAKAAEDLYKTVHVPPGRKIRGFEDQLHHIYVGDVATAIRALEGSGS